MFPFITRSWLLFAACCLPVLAAPDDTKAIPLRTHTLQIPYLDTEMQSRWFDFGGDTIIRTDSYIRLTADRQSQSGWIFSRVPLTATNWEIEFEFRVTGSGNLYGDGFALWLTKDRAQQGPVFGFKDEFEGLGLVFDTYKNNRPGTVFPYVMAMMGDGKTAYDQAHDGKANEVAGCSARGIRNAQLPTKGRLTYFQDKNLTLDLQYKTEGEWEPCFDTPDIKIPSVSYLGFTAATGDLSDNFDIIGVETKNLYSSAGGSGRTHGSTAGYRGSSSAYREGKQEEGGSWSWFFLKIVLLMVVCGGGYVGWTMYRSQRRGSRF
ncbi:MAG: hypothetical protein Q9162_001743 [Coniocarpon cinnabarinum]